MKLLATTLRLVALAYAVRLAYRAGRAHATWVDDRYDDVLGDAVDDDDDVEREFFTEWSKAAKSATSYSHGGLPSEESVRRGAPTV